MYLAAHFFMIFGALIVLAIVFAGILALGIILLTIGLISRHLNKKKGINKRYPKVCIIIGGIFMAISLGTFGMFAMDFLDDSRSKYNPDTYDPHESSLDQDIEYTKSVCADVIRCFDEGDAESLKQLFSEYSIEISDLDADIEYAMEIYDGRSISYDYSHRRGSTDVSNGYYYYKSSVGYIENLVTDSNREYYIQVKVVLVSDDEPEKVGIKTIEIMDPNNENQTLIRIGK